jgi:Uma2 family endonuclease
MTIDRQPVQKPTRQSSALPVGGSTAGRGVPPLVAGDHLSRTEFERRYEAMPHVKTAELVEGVVYMPSPATIHHGRPHAIAIGWLLAYVAATPSVELLDNTTLRIDPRSELQPDAMLLVSEAKGGKCRVDKDNYMEGSPEFVVEVAASSAAYDLHSKLRVYQRNGVQEYLVLLTYEQRALWHVLTAGKYVPMQPGSDGLLRSQVFPGLWLDPASLWANEVAGVLAMQQEGLRSPEHAEFVAHLQAR